MFIRHQILAEKNIIVTVDWKATLEKWSSQGKNEHALTINKAIPHDIFNNRFDISKRKNNVIVPEIAEVALVLNWFKPKSLIRGTVRYAYKDGS